MSDEADYEQHPDRPYGFTADEMRLGFSVSKAVAHIGELRAMAPACDSPIEVQFGARLVGKLRNVLVGAPFPFAAFDPKGGQSFEQRHLLLVPQFGWGRYRFDFAVKFSDEPLALAVIECDGAEFHSTAQQIANDRAKDAFAEHHHVPLLRFTGSDIHRQSDACAKLTVSVVMISLKRRGIIVG